MRISWPAVKSWASAIFLAALIILPLGLLIWLFLATNIFTVQAITVEDARPQTETQVRQVIEEQLKSIPRRNIFFLQTDSLAGSITSAVPQVRTVHVVSQLPGTIKAIVQEKTPVLLLLSNGHYYLIDEHGIAYEEAQLDTLPSIVLPMIKNSDAAAQVTLGVPMVSESFVNFVQTLNQKLPTVIPHKIVSISIPSLSAREVTFALENNWQIRFDVTRDPVNQLKILNQLLQGTITPDEQKNLQYIDLRIPDRVYYK